MKYKIDYIGDDSISNVHHLGISIDDNYYSVIFGKYVNGGFFSIPNLNCGGELSSSNHDVFWNMESINKALKNKEAAKIIAQAIRDYSEFLKTAN